MIKNPLFFCQTSNCSFSKLRRSYEPRFGQIFYRDFHFLVFRICCTVVSHLTRPAELSVNVSFASKAAELSVKNHDLETFWVGAELSVKNYDLEKFWVKCEKS